MRVLVTGAYGLIGSAVLARLQAAGHELLGSGRAIVAARRRFPAVRWIEADFHRLTDVDDWLPLVGCVDAVVNCVGAFQNSRRDDLRRIHVAAPAALFAACERAGVRRVIHISAVGVASRRPNSPPPRRPPMPGLPRRVSTGSSCGLASYWRPASTAP